MNSVLAPIKVAALYRLTASCLAQTSSWLPSTQLAWELPIQPSPRGGEDEGPTCLPWWRPVCSGPALSWSAPPSLPWTCLLLCPPIASLTQQSGNSSFTSVSQNGQTLGSLRQNGSEITQTAGSLNSVHLCPRKAFVKWARHTSVRGRSPAQSSHSALGAPSAQVTKRSIPAVCSWGWLTHSPLTCRCLGSPDRSSTSTRLLSHGPKLPCKQKCLLTEKPWVQPYHWGIFKTTMNHPSPKTAILLKSYQVICNHTQMYAKSCNQIPNNQKLETTQKSISH